MYAIVSARSIEISDRVPGDLDPAPTGPVEHDESVKVVGRVANVVGDPRPGDRIDARRADKGVVYAFSSHVSRGHSAGHGYGSH